jgi:hypothetical protein
MADARTLAALTSRGEVLPPERFSAATVAVRSTLPVHGPVAPTVEQRTFNPKRVGSSPTGPTATMQTRLLESWGTLHVPLQLREPCQIARGLASRAPMPGHSQAELGSLASTDGLAPGRRWPKSLLVSISPSASQALLSLAALVGGDVKERDRGALRTATGRPATAYPLGPLHLTFRTELRPPLDMGLHRHPLI